MIVARFRAARAVPAVLAVLLAACSGGGGGGGGGEPVDPCAGVVCDAPGACEIGPGTCEAATGQCTYAAQAAGTACRAAAGPCDLEEACDGLTGECPVDLLVDSSVGCRLPADQCDATEYCDGAGPACPEDRPVHAGALCDGGFAWECRGESACDGVAFACPVVPAAAGTVCRLEAGACDVADVCDGANVGCPADAVAASASACRPAAGPCDVAESCDGSSVECPADAFAGAATTCRPSAGDCDTEERCGGTDAACPADVVVAAGTVCRLAADRCDLAETCSGGSGACPPDQLAVSTFGAGTCWQKPLLTGASLTTVFAAAPDDVWAAGPTGAILHFDGAAWAGATDASHTPIAEIWAAPAGPVYAVGAGGAVRTFDRVAWSSLDLGTTEDLLGVWGSSADDVWIVGANGLVRRGSGASFAAPPGLPALPVRFNAVSGTGPDDVWLGGSGGLILRWDGAAFTAPPSDTANEVTAIHALAPDDVWAVTASSSTLFFDGDVLHWDGSAWTAAVLGGGIRWPNYGGVFAAATPTGSTAWVAGRNGATYGARCSAGASGVSCDEAFWVQGQRAGAEAVSGTSATDRWAVGTLGFMARADGDGWTQVGAGGFETVGNLRAVWGTSPADVWAAGAGIWHFDGQGWTRALDKQFLFTLWGSGPSDVWAGGASDAILAHWNGAAWTVSGSPTGTANDVVVSIWGAGASDVWAASRAGILRLLPAFSLWTLEHPAPGDLVAFSEVEGTSATDVWALGERQSGGAIFHRDATGWSEVTPAPTPTRLSALAAFAGDDVFAAGFGLETWHWDGLAWTRLVASDFTSTDEIVDLFGTSATDLWAVVLGGPPLRRWDGAGWTPVESGVGALWSGWSPAAGVAWLVGDDGTILTTRP